ncbi:hypothetical protein B0T22DRAFT_276249 [Podospora appendiculata]|uniref:Uncharacterized protein n=1 Tax=Podospora appendiculata TaxID=314037 RepID=A0AAE0X0N4_9PEZI|nr:hypothetical protein B0T22DRAFT_276249 [Podospora appendiculata]
MFDDKQSCGFAVGLRTSSLPSSASACSCGSSWGSSCGFSSSLGELIFGSVSSFVGAKGGALVISTVSALWSASLGLIQSKMGREMAWRQTSAQERLQCGCGCVKKATRLQMHMAGPGRSCCRSKRGLTGERPKGERKKAPRTYCAQFWR